MIYEFRRGTLADLVPLAKAIRWQPATDPYTSRRFKAWRKGLKIQRGDPDAYIQLVLQALTLMRGSKEGAETARDRTPQALRRRGHWITRSKRKLVPVDLQIESYIWWFRLEVTRIIKYEILPDDGHDMRGKNSPGLDSENGEWRASPTDRQRHQEWQDDERANRDAYGAAPPHFLDHLTKTSAHLRDLDRRAHAGIKVSPLQRRILDVAIEDPDLRDYREIAERLNCDRETVKNAVLRLRRKL